VRQPPGAGRAVVLWLIFRGRCAEGIDQPSQPASGIDAPQTQNTRKQRIFSCFLVGVSDSNAVNSSGRCHRRQKITGELEESHVTEGFVAFRDIVDAGARWDDVRGGARQRSTDGDQPIEEMSVCPAGWRR